MRDGSGLNARSRKPTAQETAEDTHSAHIKWAFTRGTWRWATALRWLPPSRCFAILPWHLRLSPALCSRAPRRPVRARSWGRARRFAGHSFMQRLRASSSGAGSAHSGRQPWQHRPGHSFLFPASGHHLASSAQSCLFVAAFVSSV